MVFKCRLKIEDRLRPITLKDGPSFKELGELLVKLGKCIEKDNIKFTLVAIEEASYTPIAETETIEAVEAFEKVHRDIKLKNFNELSAEEKEYSEALNKILFQRGLQLSASVDDRPEIIKLVEFIPEKVVSTYHSITTITGRIVDLVGRNEGKPYITVENITKKQFKIYISADDEAKLNHHYKVNGIRFRIKAKHDIEKPDSFIDSNLIDFYVPSNRSFYSAIQETNIKYPSIFSNIADSADLLNKIRNLSNE